MKDSDPQVSASKSTNLKEEIITFAVQVLGRKALTKIEMEASVEAMIEKLKDRQVVDRNEDRINDLRSRLSEVYGKLTLADRKDALVLFTEKN